MEPTHTDAHRPLWAPWRIELIRGPKPDSCFLCEKINPNDAAKDLEEHVISYGKTCYLLMNGFPYSSGHLMVSPYRHVADTLELDTEELNEIMDFCIKGQKILKKAINPQGFNIGFNIGTAAGAGTAEHLHLHIVPRWSGDHNFMTVLGHKRVLPESLTATTKLLKEAWNELFPESPTPTVD